MEGREHCQLKTYVAKIQHDLQCTAYVAKHSKSCKIQHMLQKKVNLQGKAQFQLLMMQVPPALHPD